MICRTAAVAEAEEDSHESETCFLHWNMEFNLMFHTGHFYQKLPCDWQKRKTKTREINFKESNYRVLKQLGIAKDN